MSGRRGRRAEGCGQIEQICRKHKKEGVTMAANDWGKMLTPAGREGPSLRGAVAQAKPRHRQ
jgi:hypothetical protein